MKIQVSRFVQLQIESFATKVYIDSIYFTFVSKSTAKCFKITSNYPIRLALYTARLFIYIFSLERNFSHQFDKTIRLIFRNHLIFMTSCFRTEFVHVLQRERALSSFINTFVIRLYIKLIPKGKSRKSPSRDKHAKCTPALDGIFPDGKTCRANKHTRNNCKDLSDNASNEFSFFYKGTQAYDTVRPLAYQDAGVFLLCFTVSDPTSLQNAVTKVNKIHIIIC